MPREAACRRQLPSPDVAKGHKTLLVSFLPPHHQFKRPAASKEVKHPPSIKSFSKNWRNESKYNILYPINKV